MLEVALASDPLSEMLGSNSNIQMDEVDKLLSAFQQGQGSFDLPPDLHMDWSVPLPDTMGADQLVPAHSMPLASTPPPQPQPFAGPISRLGWNSNSPVVASTPPMSAAPPAELHGYHAGMHSLADHSPHSSSPPPPRPMFPAIPRASARRASVPATAPGGVNQFISSQGLWESRSTPPLWSIGEGEADEGPALSGGGMRSALSADANGLAPLDRAEHQVATASSAGRRLRPSVRSASVGATSERPLCSSDLDMSLSGAKAKERNRRAQKRFRERQKVKQLEAVQRVAQLEDALDRLEVERSELSHKLKQMQGVNGVKAEDSASEQQQTQSPASQERVLTLSVPAGRERHLTGTDIKKLGWTDFVNLYEAYLEEMAAMLLQAQGDGNSPAGHRLQRLCTELITVTAALLMHDPTMKGRLHCLALMKGPVNTPLAPPDSNFWHRVTMALCLSPQQRQNCLRLRNAHLQKVQDIMMNRQVINNQLTMTLPTYEHELQAARQHLRALAVSEELQRNLRQEQGLQLELSTTFFSQALTPIQMATAATESYPWWPDILALLHAACEGME